MSYNKMFGNKWQKIASASGLVLIVGSCFFMPPVESASPVQSADVTPVHVPSTATPAPTMAPAMGLPVRVQFPKGSYGTAIFGTGSQKFLLWAKAGQKWSLYQMGEGYSNLVGPDGQALYQEAGAGMTISTTLTATGDQVLEIRASGKFTVGVEIR